MQVGIPTVARLNLESCLSSLLPLIYDRNKCKCCFSTQLGMATKLHRESVGFESSKLLYLLKPIIETRVTVGIREGGNDSDTG